VVSILERGHGHPQQRRLEEIKPASAIALNQRSPALFALIRRERAPVVPFDGQLHLPVDVLNRLTARWQPETRAEGIVARNDALPSPKQDFHLQHLVESAVDVKDIDPRFSAGKSMEEHARLER
jgi:hypothetical protein